MNTQDKSAIPSGPGIAVRTGVKSGGTEPIIWKFPLSPYLEPYLAHDGYLDNLPPEPELWQAS